MWFSWVLLHSLYLSSSVLFFASGLVLITPVSQYFHTVYSLFYLGERVSMMLCIHYFIIHILFGGMHSEHSVICVVFTSRALSTA